MDAAIEVARRQVKRAEGLLREAGRSLAAAAGDDNVVGIVHVQDAEAVDAARQLIEAGAGRHGAVDVIVVARPRRARSTPTTVAAATKEASNGTTHHDAP